MPWRGASSRRAAGRVGGLGPNTRAVQACTLPARPARTAPPSSAGKKRRWGPAGPRRRNPSVPAAIGRPATRGPRWGCRPRSGPDRGARRAPAWPADRRCSSTSPTTDPSPVRAAGRAPARQAAASMSPSTTRVQAWARGAAAASRIDAGKSVAAWPARQAGPAAAAANRSEDRMQFAGRRASRSVLRRSW